MKFNINKIIARSVVLTILLALTANVVDEFAVGLMMELFDGDQALVWCFNMLIICFSGLAVIIMANHRNTHVAVGIVTLSVLLVAINSATVGAAYAFAMFAVSALALFAKVLAKK